MRSLAIAVVLAFAGCGTSQAAVRADRPLGEDLVALVPSGAELIIDVDVQQLRTWDATERILAMLPPAAKERLERLGPHWLNDIDAAVVAAWHGDRGSESLLLLRGDLDDEHLAALLDPKASRTELAGRALFEANGQSVLRLASRLCVVGSPVDVRQVAEVIRGDLMGVRDARADQPLRDALARAPSAKHGRPAIVGAALGGTLLNERLESVNLGGRTPRWAAFAVAVGDGLDAVLILGQRSVDDATGLRDELDHTLRDLKQRPIVRILKLGAAFDLAFAVKDKELHIAYRLAGNSLDAFLARMDQGKQALETMRPQKGPPAGK